MSETPDPDIRFRTDEDTAIRQDRPLEFEDANETLDEPTTDFRAHGGGDISRGYGTPGTRGQGFDRGMNHDFNGRFGVRPQTISMKPEAYDGGEDWEEYISHFELCAELGRWHETDKVLALAAALRGQARTFYISLEQSEKRNYAALTRRLGLRFGNTRQQNRWLSRLEMRKRNPGETIATLADDLRQMAQRAYIDLDTKAQEVLALNQLYKSVTPEVKYQCTNQGCKTVAEAVEVIERYEAIIGDCSERKKGSVRMTTEIAQNGDLCMERQEGQIQDTLNGLTRRIFQLESNKPNSSNYRQNNTSTVPIQRRNFNSRQPKCYICESTNHLCKTCPYYLRYKQENVQQSINEGQRGTRDQTNRNSQSSNQGNFRTPLTR